ncbi:MAG: hypothetical protein NVS1B13_14250 [Flavisolibacter sp.]
MAMLKIDLHDIYNNNKAIDKALQTIFEQAIEKKLERLKLFLEKDRGN